MEVQASVSNIFLVFYFAAAHAWLSDPIWNASEDILLMKAYPRTSTEKDLCQPL